MGFDERHLQGDPELAIDFYVEWSGPYVRCLWIAT